MNKKELREKVRMQVRKSGKGKDEEGREREEEG